MELETMLQLITPEVHGELRRAIELGKWSNGEPLDAEQRARCLQAMIIWEARNLPQEERAGYMEESAKGCGSACGTSEAAGSGSDVGVVDPRRMTV